MPADFENFGTSGAGSSWVVGPFALFVLGEPADFIDLNSTLTFENATFESLNMTVGSGTGVLINGDTVTLNVVGTVPVTSTASLIGLGLLGLGFAHRRSGRRVI
ncbi:MAG: hypothetical protein AAGB19_18890 [Cyanobacteria bacterium P01_F01_bin.3]